MQPGTTRTPVLPRRRSKIGSPSGGASTSRREASRQGSWTYPKESLATHLPGARGAASWQDWSGASPERSRPQLALLIAQIQLRGARAFRLITRRRRERRGSALESYELSPRLTLSIAAFEPNNHPQVQGMSDAQ